MLCKFATASGAHMVCIIIFMIFLTCQAHTNADCVALDAMPADSPMSANTRHVNSTSFFVSVKTWNPALHIRVTTPLRHASDTNENTCSSSCVETGLWDLNCGWCHCATCPTCRTRASGNGCFIPGDIIGCKGAVVTSRDPASASAVLRLDESPTADRRFSCHVALSPGASLSSPVLSCASASTAEYPPSPPSIPDTCADGLDIEVTPSSSSSLRGKKQVSSVRESEPIIQSRIMHISLARWTPGAVFSIRLPAVDSTVKAVWGAQLVEPPQQAGGVGLLQPADQTLHLLLGTPPREYFAVEYWSRTLETPTVSCESPRAGLPSLPAPKAQTLPTCLGIKGEAFNLREGTRPRWCHDISVATADKTQMESMCATYYYQLTPDWLVRCEAGVAQSCKAGASKVACMQLIRRAPPTPLSSLLAPAAPPAWMAFAAECRHLLRAPYVEPLTSASFGIRPRLGDPPAPRCEQSLSLQVEYSRDGMDWQPTRLQEPLRINALVVDNVRCSIVEGGGCRFRVRPTGWKEASLPSKPVQSVQLPAKLEAASRVELAFALGSSGTACLTCKQGKTRLAIDLARILRLPHSSYVRIIEVRGNAGRAEVVLDLAPPADGRSSEALVEQLANMVSHTHSELYGGDLTQFVDPRRGVIIIHASGRVEPFVVTLSSGTPWSRGRDRARSAAIPLVSIVLFSLLLGVCCALFLPSNGLSNAGRLFRQQQYGEVHGAVPNDADDDAFASENASIDPMTPYPVGLPDLRSTPRQADGSLLIETSTKFSPSAAQQPTEANRQHRPQPTIPTIAPPPADLHSQSTHIQCPPQTNESPMPLAPPPQPAVMDLKKSSYNWEGEKVSWERGEGAAPDDLLPVVAHESADAMSGFVTNIEMKMAEPIRTEEVFSDIDGSVLLRF